MMILSGRISKRVEIARSSSKFLASAYFQHWPAASCMAATAKGEGPKTLSLAPSRALNGAPRWRSCTSGPKNGTVAGRLAIRSGYLGPVISRLCQAGKDWTSSEEMSCEISSRRRRSYETSGTAGVLRPTPWNCCRGWPSGPLVPGQTRGAPRTSSRWLDPREPSGHLSPPEQQETLMAQTPPPFAPFEWMIAWRYLRARRAEGGVSVMTWISLIGITLAVFALIATLAVRSGFRAEFVDTILGSNAHVTVYSAGTIDEVSGQLSRTIDTFDSWAENLRELRGVTRVAPLVKGQVMASARDRNAGVQVFGIAPEDLRTIPRVADPETSRGDIARFGKGIAIGSGVAHELGVTVGERIKLISPNGVK